MGRGAVTEQIELMFFDAIFHLSAWTVVLAVELSGRQWQRGHHKMTMDSFGIVGHFTPHAALSAPRV